MKTKVQEITPQSLEEAKAIILDGGVVAIPTETVYGLGGNAFDDTAVARIFEVKGRPNDNPLIAHVHSDYDLSKIIDYDPPFAKELREAFLPGPLTLVYPSKGKVSRLVSCGLETLAVRVPSHEGAQAFLRTLDVPIVAPSANLSKHVSPTSAQHVLDDFNGKIPLILDGGQAEGGIESTVCDLTGDVPTILRPGLITREMIEKVTGICHEASAEVKKGERAKSPGMLYKHYAPRCESFLFSGVEEAKVCAEKYLAQGKKVAILCESEKKTSFLGDNVAVLDLGKSPREMANRLYASLREAEKIADVLVAVEPSKKGEGMVGVMNRLKKACESKDIAH